MKALFRIPTILLLTSLLFVSCEKEYSSESGGSIILPGGGSSEGELGGAPSGCSNTEISGTYGVGLALTSSNTVLIEMDFTKAGTYYISSDTVNGIHFSATGSVTATGVADVLLVGAGTPTTAGTSNFTVSFKGSQCSFAITVLPLAQSNGTADYFPTTSSSFWKFVSSDPAADPEDTLRNTALNVTAQLNGNTYNVFLSSYSGGEDTLIFRKASGNYYQYGDLDVAGAADNVVAAEYTFLKDNVNAGTSWESPAGDANIAGSTVKIKLVSTINEKNVTVTVGTRVYKDVIKVSTAEQVQLPTGWTPILTYETWYAKGIGVINIPAPLPFYGYYLDSYQVR